MLFFVSVILLLLTLTGTLQLLFLTVSSLRKRRPLEGSANEAAAIRLAVVIPAHNEEAGIANTLESFLACDEPLSSTDIYVVADNCDDDTADIARRYNVSVIERRNEEERGKGYALNFAFTQLLETNNYDAFVVVDADSRVSKNFTQEFRKVFAGGADAAQASNLVDQHETNTRTRLMNIAFWANNVVRLLGRQNAGLSVGIMGNGFGLSTSTLREVPYESYSIVEDLEYHLSLIDTGRKSVFAKDAAVYSVSPASASEAESQRVRWEGGRFGVVKENVPKLAKKVAKGNLSLTEPLADLLLLPLAFHVTLLLLTLILGSGFTFGYALFGLLVVLLHICVASYFGGCDRHDFFALCKAPFYIMWKLSKVGKIFKASLKNASWQRTKR